MTDYDKIKRTIKAEALEEVLKRFEKTPRWHHPMSAVRSYIEELREE